MKTVQNEGVAFRTQFLVLWAWFSILLYLSILSIQASEEEIFDHITGTVSPVSHRGSYNRLKLGWENVTKEWLGLQLARGTGGACRSNVVRKQTCKCGHASASSDQQIKPSLLHYVSLQYSRFRIVRNTSDLTFHPLQIPRIQSSRMEISTCPKKASVVSK